jgi:hypothetical protein
MRISQPQAARVGFVVVGVVVLLSVPAVLATVFAAQGVPGGTEAPMTGGTAAPDESVPEPREVPGGPDAPVVSDGAAPVQIVTHPRGVTGLVQAPDGSPVPSAFVSPESLASPPVMLPEIAILTDALGVYHWDLPPGPYRLTFTAEGYQPAQASVSVPLEGGVLLDVTLTPS